MALVVNGICRYAFNGTYLDRPWVNILDMQIDTTGTVIDRDDAIYDTAGHLMNAWGDHIASLIMEEATLDNVSWVDLNSLAGSTGERTSTSEYTAPIPGENVQEPSAGNLAVLVQKQIVASRGKRNGRWYQVAPSEGATAGNELGGPQLANWQSTFSDFLDMVNDDGALPGGLERRAVVVHTTGPNPTTGTFSPINSMNVQARLATQRRRLRG